MPTTDDYIAFFLNSRSGIVQYECIEFAHPSFSKTYRIVRNNAYGLTVTHEDGQQYLYDYYPLQIDAGNTKDDLDQSLNISIGDLGEELPAEFERALTGAYSEQAPTLKYRIYRSDVLTAPMYSLQTLEVTSVSMDGRAATFEAKAPELNNTKTGRLYTLDRFPMLRGFL